MTHSDLEESFLTYWRMFGLLTPPVRQYRFYPARRWKADFCWTRNRVIVEVDGGIWKGRKGRHTNPAGFIADSEKLDTATALGYAVLRIPGPTLLEDPQGTVALVVKTIRQRRVPGLRAVLNAQRAAALGCRPRIGRVA